jgi:hypothetical protein
MTYLQRLVPPWFLNTPGWFRLSVGLLLVCGLVVAVRMYRRDASGLRVKEGGNE